MAAARVAGKAKVAKVGVLDTLTLLVDEPTAKAAKGWKSGQWVTVRGTLAAVITREPERIKERRGERLIPCVVLRVEDATVRPTERKVKESQPARKSIR